VSDPSWAGIEFKLAEAEFFLDKMGKVLDVALVNLNHEGCPI
jgi:hypothetical protein